MNELTATITVKISGEVVKLNISIPDKQTTQDVILPLFWQISQIEEDIAIKNIQQEGRQISCKAGCGACCSQFVPVTPIEVQNIDKYVSQLPKKQRQKIRKRFTKAIEIFKEKGLLERLLNFSSQNENLQEFGMAYFYLGIACPYLDNGSCSIHQVRPLSCRKYLVTSPSSCCKKPTPENIKMVSIPGQLSNTLTTLNTTYSYRANNIIPLSVSRLWLEQHSEKALFQHSKKWIEEVLTLLSTTKTKNIPSSVLLIEDIDTPDKL